METDGSSIAKHLASCNAKTRNNAIRQLQIHLSSQPSITEEDMRKIWKGLFYCVWHADKQPYQLHLIDRLSSLLLLLRPPLSHLYFSSFLSTLRREWSGIDSLRLDKFYLLLRRFLHHLILINPSPQFLLLLEEKTLLSLDGFPAQGVNYHIAEIFLEELKFFLPLNKETLDLLLKPFFRVLERSGDRVLLSKMRKGLFDPLIDSGRKLLERKIEGEEASVGDETEKLGAVAIGMGFSKRFFGLASSPDTVQGNRKVLFGLHQDFLKLEKDFERSDVEVSLPEAAAASELPEENGNPDRKKKKKSKKAKEMANGIDKESKSKKKKKKKKKNKEMDDVLQGDVITETVAAALEDENGGGDIGDIADIDVALDESVISNLREQFEKVAAEAGMDAAAVSLCGVETMQVGEIVSKKRKRGKGVDGRVEEAVVVVGSATGKSSKKVRFSMKSNLVWKPHSPLPPQSLRLPPSVTPRGSAMKKGIPRGPIRETALVKKPKRRGNAVKKARKGVKGAVKRLRKIRSLPLQIS